ncbi:MAG TPA: hypothetical protein VIO60_00070 [Rectinemataceae bacterium]
MRDERKPFTSLVLLYLKTSFGLTFPSREELKKPKTLVKTIAIGIGILALAADFGFIFVMMNTSLYRALAPAGLQSFILLNASATAAIIVFILAFMMALSMFSSSAAESSLLALPLRPSWVLGAKMIQVYAVDAIAGIFALLVAAGVYGINERPPAAFYIYAILNALALPLFPLALAYLILIPASTFSKLLRNRQAMLYIGGFLGLFVALGFNIYLQGTLSRMGDAAALSLLAGPDSFMSKAGRAWPPSFLAWVSLRDASRPLALAASLSNLALGLASCSAVAFLLGTSYVKSLQAFGESTARRGKLVLSADGKSGVFARRSPGTALLVREFRLMNREPIYFLNGPFVVLLLPLVLAVAYLAQGDVIRSQMAGALALLGGPAGYLIPAAFGAFLGASTSIACTAVSRDAKFLPWIRALPISPLSYFKAKFLHAELFAVFGSLTGSVIGSLVLGSRILDVFLALGLSNAFCFAFNLGGLWLDTAWPRLSWDNPMAALKQNPNAVIGILGAMAALGGLAALSAAISLPREGYATLYGFILVGICVLEAVLYPRFALRRWRMLE